MLSAKSAVVGTAWGHSPHPCSQIWTPLGTSSGRDTPSRRKSQLSVLPGPLTETMHPLTNCCNDAAVLERGLIQRGQGCHSRLGQLILEKCRARPPVMASNTGPPKDRARVALGLAV